MSKKPWEKSVVEYCQYLETVTADPDASVEAESLAHYIHGKMEEAFNAGREYHEVKEELSESEIADYYLEGIEYNPEEHYDLRSERKYKDYKDYKTQNEL